MDSSDLTVQQNSASYNAQSGLPHASRRSIISYLQEPLFLVQIGVILLLCVMIIYPISIMMNMSLQDADGTYSLKWYADLFSTPRYYWSVLNTLIIATGVAVTAGVAGTFVAWAVVRTDIPFRGLIETAAIVPFITSSFIGAMAWILLASPDVGLLNQVWRAIGFESSLINIYSIEGIIFVQALYDIPLVFLMVSGALRSMDPSLEEASFSCGAGIPKTTLAVTLPLVMPAIIGSTLLVFVLAAEQFGVPAVIGTPARIRVMTTEIVETQVSFPPRYGLGAAFCVVLVALAVFGLWLQRRVLKGRSFTTVGGKGARPHRVELGPLRWVVFGLCAMILLLAVVLPVSVLLLSSLRTIWTADFRWEQFTFSNYYWVLFEYPLTQRGIANSLMLAFIGATVTMLLASTISFLIVRARVPGRRLLEFIALLPLGFPGVVLGFGLLQAWIFPPFVLYGTIWILLLAYTTHHMPIGVRSTSATIVQIHPELEEASLSSGAGWLRTFRSITLPLLKPGIIAGWSLLFVLFTREFSSSVLLYSPGQEVLSVVIYDLQQAGQYRGLSALAIIQIAIAITVLAVMKIMTRRTGNS